MKYNLAVCGGTFDHFHKGHREFLRYALSICNKLLIGLTTEKYVKAKNGGEGIENYKLRKQQLEEFLHEENAIDRVLIEPIDDIFIPKIWEYLSIDAIIVSENTVWGAKKINLRRKEQGKAPLKIETSPLIKSEDNEYISSSKIRGGEINREGRPYIDLLWLNKKLFITDQLRQELKKPFGTVLVNNVILANEGMHQTVRPEVRPESPTAVRDAGQAVRRPELTAEWASMTYPYLITVGDVTTKTFNDLGFNQDISVIDLKVARKKEFSDLTELGFSGGEKIFRVNNPAGCLTPALFEAVSKIFKLEKSNRRIIIQIDGEEDLSVLPLTLGSPLGSVIFYGQPREGVVKVKVSEKSKAVTFSLVSKFRLSSASTRGH